MLLADVCKLVVFKGFGGFPLLPDSLIDEIVALVSVSFSTIFSAYKNAQNKDQLIFSVCDQSDNGIKVEEIEFRNQIHYEHVDQLFSKGPCWA